MPDSRSKKRKTQYEAFIEQFMDTKESENIRNAGAELAAFWNDIKKYLDFENPDNAEIDKKKLREILLRYVNIADRLATNIPPKDRAKVAKLRKIMGKDIKVINDALKDPEEKTYRLWELFDKSRATQIEIDENEIVKSGGALNSRMHITTKVDGTKLDGYFTVESKPYSPSAEKLAIFKNVSGDDEDKWKFVSYLMNVDKKKFSDGKFHHVSTFIDTYMKCRAEQIKCDLGRRVRSTEIRAMYATDKDYRKTFADCIKHDFLFYCKAQKIKNSSPEYIKLYNFVVDELCGNDAKFDKLNSLIDGVNDYIYSLNKESVYASTKINRKAKVEKRNSAMSSVAELLDLSRVVAQSESFRVKITGKDEVLKGTFMKKADGLDMMKPEDAKQLMELSPESVEHSPQLIKDLADIQILDYICGNVDRHVNNFSYKVEYYTNSYGEKKIKLVGIQGFDNDTSFGANDFDMDPHVMRFVKLEDIHIITRKTAESIMSLQPEMLRTILAGYDLSDEEIEGAVHRLDRAKNAIIAAMNNYVFESKNKIRIKEAKGAELKIVDDEDIEEMSMAADLDDDKDGRNAISRGEHSSKEINLFTLLNLSIENSVAYSNLMEITYRDMTNQILQIRKIEYKSKSAVKYFDDNMENMPYKNTDEYKDMSDSVEAMKKSMEKMNIALRPSKEGNLENIVKIYKELSENTSLAILNITTYILNWRKKQKESEEKGETITEKQKERIDALQAKLDVLEEVYSGYNNYLRLTDSLRVLHDEFMKKRENAKVERGTILDEHESTEKKDSIEKTKRMIETDMNICLSNMERIRGGDTNPFIGRVTMNTMIQVYNRKAYLSLLNDELTDQQRNEFYDNIAVNNVIRRVFINSEEISKEVAKNPQMIVEIREKARDLIFSNELIKNNAREFIDNQTKNLKKTNTPAEILNYNFFMKNGMGTLDDDTVLYENVLINNSDRGQKVAEMIEDLIKEKRVVNKENEVKEVKIPEHNEVKNNNRQHGSVKQQAIKS